MAVITHRLDQVPGNASEQAFIDAYVSAALWASDDDNGECLWENYSQDDIAPETLAAIEKDCADFLNVFWRDLFVPGVYCGRGKLHAVEMAGHDFWLTRNGHGAGFWDGDWLMPYSVQFDTYSKSVGAFTLYVGDDGKIHGMKG